MQKTCAIIGSTAFIVWLLMAFENGAFSDFGSFIDRGIYGRLTDWYHTLTFTIWFGSLIAFNVYKD